MNTLLAILKVTDARRDVILAGELNLNDFLRDTSPSPSHTFPCHNFPLTKTELRSQLRL